MLKRQDEPSLGKQAEVEERFGMEGPSNLEKQVPGLNCLPAGRKAFSAQETNVVIQKK